MRIIGGIYKSRLISMPVGIDIRPTQDKVRQAIFNVIGGLSGVRALELFAGSGAFGIEAISRGASHVTFVDNNLACVRAIEKNIASLGISGSAYDIIKTNAVETFPMLSRLPVKYDLVFLDPPYHQDMARKTLLNIDAYDILAPISLVVAEHYKKDQLPEDLKTLVIAKEKRYGDVVVTLYRKKP
jgi:16S rRNA (guanine(966)-N(2))-methyltransferase RsmD